MKTFFFRRLRRKAGLSIKELQRKTNLGLTHIYNWDSDFAPLPPKHYKTIAEQFGVSPEVLIKHNIKTHEKIIREKSGVR